MTKELTIIAKNNDKLPEGWSWFSLGKVANVIAGNPAPQGKQFFEDGTYPFVRVQDMGRLGTQRLLTKTNDYINDKAIQKLKLIPKGGVLFTKSGASTLLNQRAILGSDMYVVSHIAAAIPHDGIKSEWLYYWLKTVDFNYIAHATTLPSLPLSTAREIPVPVAPINEQKCIVAEIEKQFSRLDEAVDNLKRVKVNLKRYKASVLKAAVEGKLTEDWRKSNPDVEPADKLLERILAERCKKWEEAELAKMRARGKAPKDGKWKKKYKAPIQVNVADFPELPEGWSWATISQISSDALIGLVRSKAEQNTNGKGVGYIKMNNVTMDGRVTTGDLVFVNADRDEKKRFNLSEGDILFNTRNSLELVGKVGLVKKKLADLIFNNNLMRIRVPNGVDSTFIVFQMCSLQFRKKMEGVKRATTNVAAIYRKDLMPLPISLPSKDEQVEISKEIEQRYFVVEEFEASIESNMRRAERLRQSILKKAFSGKLTR